MNINDSIIGTPVVAKEVELPSWASRSTNLANPRLGAKAIFATDDFFAPIERMLNPEPAVFIPEKYDDNGKWMDGWESRRKRECGYDFGIIKLGRKGKIYGFDFDTSHFTGNFAPAVSVDAVNIDSDDLEAIKTANWQEIMPSRSLNGNSHHLVELEKALQKGIWSHLRINIYPDGGMARLRVYGQPMLEKIAPNALLDLVAMENGGRALAWNDAHFGVPQNMLLPGKGINMGDGWETRRRREPGSDWCILQLGCSGKVQKVEVDTAFYKGNFADKFSIQAMNVTAGTDQSIITQSMFWPHLLSEQKLGMDKVFNYEEQVQDIGLITHVRLNIIPDGGISRLRLWGKTKG